MLTERIRANPTIPAAEWPFKPSTKQRSDIVISTIRPRLKVKWCDQERQQRSVFNMITHARRERSAA